MNIHEEKGQRIIFAYAISNKYLMTITGLAYYGIGLDKYIFCAYNHDYFLIHQF